MGSICQAGGNLGSTSYLTGSITNFRVNSSYTAYQNPWGTRLSYTKVYPLEKLGSTTVLLQGSPIVNMASPLSIVTALSIFPITMMPPLLNNAPTSLPGAYNTRAEYIGVFPCTPALSNAFTFECWANIDANLSKSTCIFDTLPPGTSNGGTPGRLICYVDFNNVVMAYVGNATPNFRNLSSVITPGVWNHIAWVWNGATSVMTCYLNGVAGAPVSIAGGLNVITNGITIGVNCDTLSQFAQSTLYQPLMRNRAVYTSNFTPSQDLTPAALDTSVVYFLGPSLVEQVSGSVVQTAGTVVNTYRGLA